MYIGEVFDQIVKEGKKDYSNVLYLVPSSDRVKQVENIFLKKIEEKNGNINSISFFPPQIITYYAFAKNVVAKVNKISELSVVLWDNTLFNVLMMNIIGEIPSSDLEQIKKQRIYNKSKLLSRFIKELRQNYTKKEIVQNIEQLGDEGIEGDLKEYLKKYFDAIENYDSNATYFDIFELLENINREIKKYTENYDYIFIEKDNIDNIYNILIDALKNKYGEKVKEVSFNIKEELIDIEFFSGVSVVDEADLIVSKIVDLLNEKVRVDEIGVITDDILLASAVKFLLKDKEISANVKNKNEIHPLFNFLFDLIDWGEKGLQPWLIGKVLESQFLSKKYKVKKNRIVKQIMSYDGYYRDIEEIEEFLEKGNNKELTKDEKEIIKKIQEIHERLNDIDDFTEFLMEFVGQKDDTVVQMLSEIVAQISKIKIDTNISFYSFLRFIIEQFSVDYYRDKDTGLDIVSIDNAKVLSYKYTFLSGFTSNMDSIKNAEFPVSVLEKLKMETIDDKKREKIDTIYEIIKKSEKTFMSFYQYDSNAKEKGASVIVDHFRYIKEEKLSDSIRRENMVKDEDGKEKIEGKEEIASLSGYVFKKYKDMTLENIVQEEIKLNVHDVIYFIECDRRGLLNLFTKSVLEAKKEEDYNSRRNFEIGNFYHAVFHNAYEIDGFKETKDEEEIKKIMEESFEKTMEEFEFKYVNPNNIRSQKNTFIEQFAENESEFRSNPIKEWQFKEIVGAEEEISYKGINGKIDRIDLFEKETGEKLYLIGDYKKGFSSYGAKLYDNTNQKLLIPQLNIYIAMLKKEIGDDNVYYYGTLINFSGKRKNFYTRSTLKNFDVYQKNIDIALDKIKYLLKSIKERKILEWWQNGVWEDSKKCTYCPYKNICKNGRYYV